MGQEVNIGTYPTSCSHVPHAGPSGTQSTNVFIAIDPTIASTDNRYNWATVTGGAGTTCATKASGSVFCWGSNADGANGFLTGVYIVQTPTGLVNLDEMPVSFVRVGTTASCTAPATTPFLAPGSLATSASSTSCAAPTVTTSLTAGGNGLAIKIIEPLFGTPPATYNLTATSLNGSLSFSTVCSSPPSCEMTNVAPGATYLVTAIGINADQTLNSPPYAARFDFPGRPSATLLNTTFSTCKTWLQVVPDNSVPFSSIVVTAVPLGNVTLPGARTRTKTWTFYQSTGGDLSIPLIPGTYSVYVHVAMSGTRSPYSSPLNITVLACPWVPGVTCGAGGLGYWWNYQNSNSLSMFPAQDSVPSSYMFDASAGLGVYPNGGIFQENGYGRWLNSLPGTGDWVSCGTGS